MKRILALVIVFGVLYLVVVPRPGQQQTDGGNSDEPLVLKPKATLAWPPGLGDEATSKPSTLSVDVLTAKNYYVVFDASGSMDEKGCSGDKTKIQVAKESLHRFVTSVPASANLGLLTFAGDGVKEKVALGRDNREAFLKEVDRTQSGGGTPLRSAIRLAREKIEEQARSQLGYGDYTLVVVTDGEASDGEDPRGIVNGIVGDTRILVHTIGFCIGKNHSLNQPMLTEYRAASSPEELTKGLEDVLAEAESFQDAKFSK